MFGSRAFTSTQTGHRCTSSAKFTSTRQIENDIGDRYRIDEVEDETHPKRSLACSLISSVCCPILGIIAIFYAVRAVRAHSQGFYAEATIFYKKAIRWSLITFIIGLVLGSIIAFTFFVKTVLDHHIHTTNMFSIVILALLSSVKAQYYNHHQQQQQQYSYNNLNLRPFHPQTNAFGAQGMQQNPRVRGNLISDDTSMLPFGSQIVVSLADVSLQDVASRPLNTLVLYGSYRFPIPFEIPYSMAQVQINSNSIRQYAIQARIEKDGQLLYINDQYTPVQLIPAPINPINVFMKKISTSTFPGNFGTYTPRPPIMNSPYICLQNPDIGPCKASIEQYFFNAQLGSCQIFFWGGCGGNQNRFNSLSECERTCSFYRRRMITNNAKQRWIK
ncbi:unnamed protein product [Rotaria sp. Silwood1]|nr:unnamed protein product [Rotaria sp. Silwood1]CAF3502582.1 unnamed protein product [Rotaria sp. Silwood1]CAF4780789.1 unnamed protein product [Rotaria sp. Silwood1]CAF4936506.1 unnamed protein product [Rotaria sp. Silwood1]